MPTRNLTLTSIGLPIRTELRIKSMLEVVKNMTVDNWSYSPDGAADLAICEPNSALTAVAIKRAKASGGTRCVLLVKDDHSEPTLLPMIRDPVRPTDFLSLLNSVSEQGDHGSSETSGPSSEAASTSNGVAVAKDNAVFLLALAIRSAAR